MQLTKHHGLGNDFLIRRASVLPDNAAVLAARLCDRRRGIGADGLIFGVEPVDAANDVAMVLFNSDGTRAEMSGNGIRCLAQACVEGRQATTLAVETDAGLRRVEVQPCDSPAAVWAQVDMGAVTAGPSADGVTLSSGELRCATADLGNPHLVVLVEDPDSVQLDVDGPRHEAGFAGGINVEFIAPAEDSAIELRVWERGAGVTEACGSGACAAAHHAHAWGLVNDKVDVRMPGGIAEVSLGDSVLLAGPSVRIATIEVADD